MLSVFRRIGHSIPHSSVLHWTRKTYYRTGLRYVACSVGQAAWSRELSGRPANFRKERNPRSLIPLHVIGLPVRVAAPPLFSALQNYAKMTITAFVSTVSASMRHSWCSFDSLMFFIASKGFINKLNQGPLDFRIHTKFCHTASTKSKGILLFNSDKYYRNKFELLFITILISKDFKTSSIYEHRTTWGRRRERKEAAIIFADGQQVNNSMNLEKNPLIHVEELHSFSHGTFKIRRFSFCFLCLHNYKANHLYRIPIKVAKQST